MSSLPSRKVSAAFVGVFVIGILVGGMLMNDYVGMQEDARFSRFMSRTNDPLSMAARINDKYKSDYALSDAEQKKIAPLTREMSIHLYQVRRQFGLNIVATLNDYHHRIAEQMTPEHRAAYEAANQDRQKHMISLLFLDENPPDQAP